MVAAEIARLEGRELDAERLYEEAIRSAREHGFVQNEGLANEVAARFYAARGFETIAHAYLREARYCYLRWGAIGKVRQLEQLHPHLRDAPVPASPTTTIGAPVEQLDVGTVVKASQAVSGEIVLGKLIETLMRIALEHAGAERGLLILFPGDEPRIEAEATTGRGQVEVTLRQTAVSPAELPESVLHYVIRTRESVILDDASAQNPFSADEYICQKHARSRPLPAPGEAGQADRGALSREQPGVARVHAGPDLGAGTAGVAGGDLAGERPSVQRSPGTGGQDPPPGRLEHHRDRDLGCSRPDHRSQRSLSRHGGIRPGRSRLGSAAMDGADARRMARRRRPGCHRRAEGDRNLQPSRKSTSAKMAAACRFWSAARFSKRNETKGLSLSST